MRQVLIGAGAVMLTVFLYGNNLHAQWGCIDDHVIAQVLGSDHVMHFSEWWPELMKTEVGRPGRDLRCRPAYLAIYIVETVLWGDSPWLWYLARLIYISVSLALAWELLSQWLGLWGGALVAAWIVTYRYWFDIYCRLGPAEIYAVMGFVLFMYGFVAISRRSSLSRAKSAVAWMLVCAGSLICIGSKENFSVLLPGVWVAAWFAWRRRGLRMGVITGVGVVTALTLFIVCAVGVAVSTGGGDMYAKSVAPSARLSLLGLGSHDLWRATWWHMERWQVAGGLIASLAAVWACIRLRKIPVYVLQAGLAVTGLALFYVLQFVFYNGELPGDCRYDFPGMIVVPLIWATVGWMLVRIADETSVQVVRLAVRVTMACAILLIVVSNQKMPQIRAECLWNVSSTRRFTTQMQDFAMQLKADAERPLTLLIRDAKDYEKIDAVVRFLRFYGVTNDIFLECCGKGQSFLHSALEGYLKKNMQTRSLEGESGLLMPLRLRSGSGYVIELSAGLQTRAKSLGFVQWFDDDTGAK